MPLTALTTARPSRRGRRPVLAALDTPRARAAALLGAGALAGGAFGAVAAASASRAAVGPDNTLHAAMRQRMVQHMETIPGFADIGKMAWYPGKQYPGTIRRAQASVRARV